MIGSGEKIEGNLLMITNELDDLGEKHVDMIPKKHQKDFINEVEDIKKDLLHIIDVSRQVKEVIERAYR